MKHLLLLGFFFQGVLLFAQDLVFQKGQLTDSVVVRNSNKETYALYLPTSFDQEQLSKIIFVFDPAARGKTGVSVFKTAAEKYNYVVVGSNNSKNGPYELNFGIANRLFEDVFSRFNIDNTQIYVAGFSGGSRLAASIAILTNQMAGVIACGAGFAQQPNLENNFNYVGLVGNEDMNYQEMRSNISLLNNLNITNTLITYSDGHNWPPLAQIERAIGWLELQASKKRLVNNKPNFMGDYYTAELDIVDQLIASNQPYEAVNEMNRFVGSLELGKERDSLMDKIAKLKQTDNYIKTASKVNEIEKLEYQLTEMFLNRFRAESFSGKTEDNFEWWKTELSKLYKYNPATGAVYEEKMFKRIKYRLFAMAIENSNIYLSRNNWQQANYCDKLLTLMLPDNPAWHYRLATSYAHLDNLSATIKHIKQAAKLGFKDHTRLYNDASFSKFKNEKRFIRLLESLQLN